MEKGDFCFFRFAVCAVLKDAAASAPTPTPTRRNDAIDGITLVLRTSDRLVPINWSLTLVWTFVHPKNRRFCTFPLFAEFLRLRIFSTSQNSLDYITGLAVAENRKFEFSPIFPEFSWIFSDFLVQMFILEWNSVLHTIFSGTIQKEFLLAN